MNLYDLIINHPGRKEALQYFDKYYVAATPPSKGGETLTRLFQYKKTLKLMVIPLAPPMRGTGFSNPRTFEPSNRETAIPPYRHTVKPL